MPTAPRILVVDDNDALRENLCETLELEGYAVEAVGSGQEALDALRRDPLPGVVLLDMMMPGMTGRELLATLRTEPRLEGLKVVLLSGHHPPRGAEAVDAVLGKPFGVEDLLRVVGRFVPPPTLSTGST